MMASVPNGTTPTGPLAIFHSRIAMQWVAMIGFALFAVLQTVQLIAHFPSVPLHVVISAAIIAALVCQLRAAHLSKIEHRA